MITATLGRNWRDDCFGKTDFEKLEYFLSMAYHVCKDIDSTDWFENWPDEIRMHIASALNAIYEWNRDNELHSISPTTEEARNAYRQVAFKRFMRLRDVVYDIDNTDDLKGFAAREAQ